MRGLSRILPLLLLALTGFGVRAHGSARVQHQNPSPKKEAAWQREIDERAVLLDPKECRIGRQVADIELAYLDGTRGRLAQEMGPKGLVVFVRGAECPVSKRYGSETARIEDEYRPRGLGFLFVDMEDPSAPAEIREEVGAFGFEGRYALDPEQRLGLELGATRTSEVFLLDAARTLLYRGAIDDQYGRGVILAEPRTRFLRDALESLLSGKPVQVEATKAPGCVLPAKERVTSAERASPTYHRDVSRILQQNCVECHRKGGAGPFALDSLEAVRRKRAMIETVVQEGSMPPWFAAPGTGPWLKERRLTTEERGTLLGWLAAGAPEGEASDAPQPRQWRDGWRIGEPDLILPMPEPFQVPAEGLVDLQYFQTEATPADMWVKSIQLLPEAVQVVHHVVVYIRMPDKPQEYFYAYVPGCAPLVYDDSVARFVPAGSCFRFDVHYTPNGIAVSDRTRMGFVRARRPPDFEAFMRTLTNQELFIPAGASDVSFNASFELPWRTMIRSVAPHMHARGKAFRLEAFRPDGTSDLLIQLDHWDSEWQYYYDFREWRDYPVGTKLLATAWYDNSAANPDNPDPSVDVRYGTQTTDEMMLIGLEWVRPNRRPALGER